MLSNKFFKLKQRLAEASIDLRLKAKEFRVYDLGSVALDRLTSRQGYSFKQHQAYGLKARQRFDVYLSHSQRFAQKPVVVFVYGGAWVRGDKSHYRFIGEALCRHGYDVVVINYHHAPEHKFPTYVNDLAQALDYLKQHQQRLGLNSEKIALMGHSAGAFNVMSLLYHPDTDQFDLSAVRAVIGIAGPYHFDYLGDKVAEDAFDQSIPYQQVMPYYFVKPNHIQHYLFLAERDNIVKAQNSHDLHTQLLKQGNHSQLAVIPKTGHVTVIGSLSSLFNPFFETQKKVIQALDHCFFDQK